MHKFTAVALLAIGAVTLSACGGHDGMNMSSDENAPVVNGATNITVTGEDYRFSPATFEMAAGTPVNIELTAADIEHDVTVKGIGHIVHADGNQTDRGGLTIDEPGTYTFYCSVPGHRAEGMEGRIVVT